MKIIKPSTKRCNPECLYLVRSRMASEIGVQGTLLLFLRLLPPSRTIFSISNSSSILFLLSSISHSRLSSNTTKNSSLRSAVLMLRSAVLMFQFLILLLVAVSLMEIVERKILHFFDVVIMLQALLLPLYFFCILVGCELYIYTIIAL